MWGNHLRMENRLFRYAFYARYAWAEGKAGERSQSMLIAQLFICFGFLLFLAYPAVYNIFNVNTPEDLEAANRLVATGLPY